MRQITFEAAPDKSLVMKVDGKSTSFKLLPDVVAKAKAANTLYPKLKDQLIKIIETRLEDTGLNVLEQKHALREVLAQLELKKS